MRLEASISDGFGATEPLVKISSPGVPELCTIQDVFAGSNTVAEAFILKFEESVLGRITEVAIHDDDLLSGLRHDDAEIGYYR